MSDQEEMDALDNNILGTVTVRAPHQADYEHNFHLSNNQTPLNGTTMTDCEYERKIYEIAQKLIDPVKQELEIVKQLHNTAIKENQHLKEKVLKMESYSRRSNLKFYGFTEQKGESKFDSKRFILNTLLRSGIQLHQMAIENSNRVGPQLRNKNRAILAKFFHGQERDLVLKKAEHIYRTTGIRVEEDFPEEIEKKRKVLKPIMHAANNIMTNGRHKYYASLRVEKLNINGRLYTTDTVHNLPEDINPITVATPSKNNITAFFGRDSPLSNHHLAPQKIGKITFNCNEQYYMSEKAKTFNDHVTVDKILKETDPGQQKKLGSDRNIAGFQETTWKNKCLEVMETGLKAKMDQNPSIKNFLLNTGSNMLLEANPSDAYWGVKMSKFNRRIWIKNSWSGTAQNHLGRLLSELRTVYKRSNSLE